MSFLLIKRFVSLKLINSIDKGLNKMFRGCDRFSQFQIMIKVQGVIGEYILNGNAERILKFHLWW